MTTILSTAAVLALANVCVGPSLAPIMAGIAQHESGLDTTAIHRNANGTVDVGLAQVNSTNFGWLGLTMQTALDPCRNLAAGARVLLVRYNGNPDDAGKVAYANGVTASIRAFGTPPPPPPVREVLLEDVPGTPDVLMPDSLNPVWMQHP